MKIIIKALLIAASLAMLTCVALSQPVSLKYTFIKGKSYIYRQVFDQTDVQNHGSFEDSFVHTVDMKVQVEDVDSNGQASLLCTVLKQGYVRKNRPDTISHNQLSDSLRIRGVSNFRPSDEMPSHKTIQLNTGRPDLNPKFRVAVTAQGACVSGSILEKSEFQKQWEEKPSDPNVRIVRHGNERPWESDFRQFFKPLPQHEESMLGIPWTDTTPTDAGRPESITKEQRTFTLSEGPCSDSIPCRFLREKLRKTQRTLMRNVEGYSERNWVGATRTSFRAGDGVYLGYETMTAAQSIRQLDSEENPEITDDSKFIIKATLLREE